VVAKLRRLREYGPRSGGTLKPESFAHLHDLPEKSTKEYTIVDNPPTGALLCVIPVGDSFRHAQDGDKPTM
jgi:hypothetical protein